MNIGQLSKRTNVSARMLRYYEEQGLLQPARTKAGYRTYTSTDIESVERIVALNNVGLTLETIKDILQCPMPNTPGTQTCPAMKNRIQERLALVDTQIEKLISTRQALVNYLQNIN